MVCQRLDGFLGRLFNFRTFKAAVLGVTYAITILMCIQSFWCEKLELLIKKRLNMAKFSNFQFFLGKNIKFLIGKGNIHCRQANF